MQQREQEHVINVTNKDDDYSEVTISNYYTPNGNNTAPALDGFIVKSTDLSSPRHDTAIAIPKRVEADSDVYSSQVNSPLVSSGTKVTLTQSIAYNAHGLFSPYRVQQVHQGCIHWPPQGCLKVNQAARCQRLNGKNSCWTWRTCWEPVHL